MLSLALAIMIVIVGMVLVASTARSETAYVRPVHEWSPHVAPQAYKAPRHIRRIQRAARREKRERIWAPPVRHVAKVWPIQAPRCAHPVSAVGTEHYSEDDAKSAAIKSWMAEVRHRLGTESMDIHNATDVAFRCVISTPGDRVSDKIAKWTRGDLLKECRIVATPCRPEVDGELPMGVRK